MKIEIELDDAQAEKLRAVADFHGKTAGEMARVMLCDMIEMEDLVRQDIERQDGKAGERPDSSKDLDDELPF